ncbi:MAG: transposase [Bacteroidaceae bacterium]|nr:transposase [Bacteroidaceae bacterium]
MKREVYESQKAFAGEKKPSMLRRCVSHDYTDRMMYMVTMVTEGRRPLFGKVVGRSDASQDSPDAPRMELTLLGQRVHDEWWGIPGYYPQVEIIALQMMPDHLHGIIFIKEKMDKDLSRIIRGFKTGCHRAYRDLFPSVASVMVNSSVATQSQRTKPKDSHPAHGLLFAPGFNDKLLLRQGQLQRWLDYLRDNPRRLLMKREHPDLFRVQRDLMVAGQQFSAIGNRFLLDHPLLLQVQCSRRLTEDQIQEKKEQLLALARKGAVLVSPSISSGEKAIMRAAFNEGLPLIILQENGFTDLAKPGGQRMEACQCGQLLLLAPWEHHNEQLTIRRSQCLQLNDLAKMICERNLAK